MLDITDKAAEKIKSLLDSQSLAPEENGLRVAVVSGGCSGYEYRIDFTPLKEGDNVYERDGVKVLVDPKSVLLLGGATVDYIESLTGAGFTIRNPNASGSCGCGTSFSV